MQPIKILSVDDEPDVESLLAQSFRKHIRSGEFDFTFAYDGAQALKRAQEQRDLEVILLDINMPVMDGLTFLASSMRLVRICGLLWSPLMATCRIYACL